MIFSRADITMLMEASPTPCIFFVVPADAPAGVSEQRTAAIWWRLRWYLLHTTADVWCGVCRVVCAYWFTKSMYPHMYMLQSLVCMSGMT